MDKSRRSLKTEEELKSEEQMTTIGKMLQSKYRFSNFNTSVQHYPHSRVTISQISKRTIGNVSKTLNQENESEKSSKEMITISQIPKTA